MVIGAGLAFQILQVFVSVRQRHQNRDLTGDPWNGRTLEWSVSSPPPEYNFAVIPTVTTRDAFWEMKKNNQTDEKLAYADIVVPKNTPIGLFIASCAFVTGFAIVWHIAWLVMLGFIGIVALLVIRTTSDCSQTIIPAEEVKRMDMELRGKRRTA
jgi:cytochrome o ubiquinol oxidase subunit 1